MGQGLTVLTLSARHEVPATFPPDCMIYSHRSGAVLSKRGNSLEKPGPHYRYFETRARTPSIEQRRWQTAAADSER